MAGVITAHSTAGGAGGWLGGCQVRVLFSSCFQSACSVFVRVWMVLCSNPGRVTSCSHPCENCKFAISTRSTPVGPRRCVPLTRSRGLPCTRARPAVRSASTAAGATKRTRRTGRSSTTRPSTRGWRAQSASSQRCPPRNLLRTLLGTLVRGVPRGLHQGVPEVITSSSSMRSSWSTWTTSRTTVPK